MTHKVHIYFRNDDPDTFEFGDKRPELRRLTDLFYQMEIPLVHGVVPKTITNETVDYLANLKRRRPDLVELIQHGYQHKLYLTGEFDHSRTYQQQYEDIARGRELMSEKLNNLHFNAFVFPFGAYTSYSMQILHELRFDVLSCYWKSDLLHRIIYTFFRPFGIDPCLKYRVSYHLRRYKKYCFVEYSNCINVIKQSNPWIYYSANELYNKTLASSVNTVLIGVVLHYNTLDEANGNANLDRLRSYLEMLKATDWIEFTTLENYFRKQGHHHV